MHTLLLVDDNTNFRTSLAIGLKREGFEVEAYGNPIEAFNRIQEREFDVLLTDLRMPYFNGYELARFALRLRPSLKVVLLSAYDFNEFIPDHQKDNSYAKLSKPFKMNELLKILSQLS